MTSVLSARGVSVSFGGVHAVVDVDLDVEPGELIGLIGPNGAGKTTFIDAITGFTKPSAGTITSTAPRSTRSHPNARAHLGLSSTFQSLELFEDLTVRDNLLVAAERPKWYSTIVDVFPPGAPTSVRSRSTGRSHHRAGERGRPAPSDLSHGQRKLVGVSRALASRPKLILLDEPAAGLDTTESSGARQPPPAVPRPGHHGVPHRPRHGPRAQRVRLHLRARLRQRHRPGHAGPRSEPTPP